MSLVRRYLQNLMPAGTSIRLELRAGLTTFLTMAYILFVNPDILGSAIPVDQRQLLTATALCAAFGSILMGALARYPFALAPGMGLNAFFAFSLVGGQGLPWQTALACVFSAGVVFLFLSASGIRRFVVESFPPAMKDAMAAGIGLFLAFIGLTNAGIVVNDEQTLVSLGTLGSPSALICFGSLAVTAAFVVRGWSSAILLGIFAGTLAAITFSVPVYHGQVFPGFAHGVVAAPVLPVDIFGKMDLSALWTPAVIAPIVLLVFVDFFDTAGTLYGLAGQSGYLDSRYQLPRANQAFFADALATTFSGIIGSSPTTTYIESASGIETGGRTGVTAIMVGCLFLLSLFFWPLITVVPAAATASALIIVGAMMIRSITRIPWHDPLQGIPAFLTIVLMPLTYSISNGIAIGIIAYGILTVVKMRFDRGSVIMQCLSAFLIIRYWLW